MDFCLCIKESQCQLIVAWASTFDRNFTTTNPLTIDEDQRVCVACKTANNSNERNILFERYKHAWTIYKYRLVATKSSVKQRTEMAAGIGKKKLAEMSIERKMRIKFF